jgi:hypothetical protein
MSSAGSVKGTKEDLGSPPQTSGTFSSPEEYVRRGVQLAANNQTQDNIIQESMQLPLRLAKAIRDKMETKGYNVLGESSSLLKSNKELGKLGDDRKVLADTKKQFSKTLFFANLYLPTSSPFRSVNTTKEQIAHFHNKIYKGVQKCALELENIPVFSQQKVKTKTELAQCKKLEHTSSNTEIKLSAKRIASEFSEPPLKDLSVEDKESFQCSYCKEVFGTGQALGGHMSRKHTGKSLKYNHKKDVRKQREFERMKLHLAKKKYFKELGYDYDTLMQTPEGKMKAKTYMNRSRIKKIKTLLSIEEIIV